MVVIYQEYISCQETDRPRKVINDSANYCQKLPHATTVPDYWMIIYCDCCETLGGRMRKSAIDGSSSRVGGTIIVQL